MDYLLKVKKTYYYRRRVPEEVKHLDKRQEVRISLKTKDIKEARIKADIYNHEMDVFWKALISSGNAHNIEEKYISAVNLAKSKGFTYRTAAEIAQRPLDRIIERIETPIENAPMATAILGGAEEPQIKLSACIDKFWPLCVDRLTGKSEHQIKKWKNPRNAAMLNFIDVVGDKPLQDITRKEVLSFREWWLEKINSGHSSDTGNKQLRFVKDMLQDVALHCEIDSNFDGMFTKTRFTVIDNPRPPFEENYVQNTLLKTLETLNEEARRAVFVMAEIGLRDCEVLGLTRADIKLDEPIPYVWIRNNLKTRTSERKIPLVGYALAALKLQQNGFNRWKNPDYFSGTVNKYLRENDLKPTKRHTLYSLRHTFKDRLRDIQAPEEIIDELMGHKKSGPKYGRGHTLETKLHWLNKIAYDVGKL